MPWIWENNLAIKCTDKEWAVWRAVTRGDWTDFLSIAPPIKDEFPDDWKE